LHPRRNHFLLRYIGYLITFNQIGTSSREMWPSEHDLLKWLLQNILRTRTYCRQGLGSFLMDKKMGKETYLARIHACNRKINNVTWIVSARGMFPCMYHFSTTRSFGETVSDERFGCFIYIIYCRVSWVPWRKIMGSSLDDWIYWRLLLQLLLITIN
jgi:hypothetical protein